MDICLSRSEKVVLLKVHLLVEASGFEAWGKNCAAFDRSVDQIFFLLRLQRRLKMTWMDADNNKEMSSIMETEHSNLSGQQSPLDINCEDAISYIQSHLQTHNISTNINLSELTSVSNFAFLERVAEMMLSPELTDCIAIAFFPLVPDLVGRWTKLGEDHREKIACALGRLIHVEPKLNRYVSPPLTNFNM